MKDPKDNKTENKDTNAGKDVPPPPPPINTTLVAAEEKKKEKAVKEPEVP